MALEGLSYKTKRRHVAGKIILRHSPAKCGAQRVLNMYQHFALDLHLFGYVLRVHRIPFLLFITSITITRAIFFIRHLPFAWPLDYDSTQASRHLTSNRHAGFAESELAYNEAMTTKAIPLLAEFVAESNRIEGIRGPANIEPSYAFLSLDEPSLEDLCEFVRGEAGAELRTEANMNVVVGNHRPPIAIESDDGSVIAVFRAIYRGRHLT